MNKLLRRTLPLLVLGTAVLIFAGLVALGRSREPDRVESGPRPLPVDVIAADLESLNLTVVSQGTVRPRTETLLVPEVSGKIVQVSPNFIAGGFFRAGEVLLQIDPSDYETALKRAQAELAARRAQYADEKARSEQAMRDWMNLGRPGEPSDLTLRKPQVAEALAAVQAAEADLQKAERDLARTRISLPYDGLVRSKQVDVAQYVSPGTTLGVTFAIDAAEVRLPLSSRDLAYLRLPSSTHLEDEEAPRAILTAAGSGIPGQWQAEIVRTEGVIDETSRVIYAVAQVIDPYALLGISRAPELRIGTFVRAEIQGIRAENVVVLPRAVLRADNTVLIANARNELEIRPVDVLRAESEQVYIQGGIEDRELVISTAMAAPIPGTRVAISDASSVNDAVNRDEAHLATMGSRR